MFRHGKNRKGKQTVLCHCSKYGNALQYNYLIVYQKITITLKSRSRRTTYISESSNENNTIQDRAGRESGYHQR